MEAERRHIRTCVRHGYVQVLCVLPVLVPRMLLRYLPTYLPWPRSVRNQSSSTMIASDADARNMYDGLSATARTPPVWKVKLGPR